MAIQVDNSFIIQYETDVHHVFQRKGAVLRDTVRFVDGVRGKQTTFQKIGKGVATTKARHGQITPMNQDHTAITCSLSDFYAGDYVDLLDESKLNIDERMAVAEGGARALGRKVDDQILTVLDSTTQTTVDWVEGTEAGVRNSAVNMVEALASNDAYEPGMMFGVLSPKAWALLSTVKEFASSDYVDAMGRPFQGGMPIGMFKNWMNVLWTVHSGTPNVGTTTGKVFLYHKNAVGYAAGAVPQNVASMSGIESPIAVDIDWQGKAASHWVNHWMSGGACLIDDTGVIEGEVDETASLPVS